MGEVLGGVIPIVVTPFDADDAIDEAGMQAQIRLLGGAGIRWVGLGYGSEVPRLTAGEIGQLVRIIRRADASIKVVANAEVTGLQTGIHALTEAAESGADAVMVRPAQVAGAPADALVDTLGQVFATVGVDVVLQDAPQHTGVVLDATTLARFLSEVEAVKAVKIEPPAGAVEKIRSVRRALDGRPGQIIGGRGGKDYLLELRAGSNGTMPGPAYVELYRAVEIYLRAGRDDQAWQVMGRFLPLMDLSSVTPNMDGFLAIQKHILNKRGASMSTRVRPPSHLIAESVFATLDEAWTALDIDTVLEELRRDISGAE